MKYTNVTGQNCHIAHHEPVCCTHPPTTIINLHEMPMSYSQDPLAGQCVEHRYLFFDRTRPCVGSNRPSSQHTLWTCSQTFWGHTFTCPVSTKPCGATSICHSVASQVQVAGDVQATIERDGLTNSAETTVHHQWPPADLWRRAVICGHSRWCYSGPRSIRTNGKAMQLD